ncbi:CHS1 [Mytilus coruscus]|uniref:CHS1 n=1 Tax=Mytilus coruscus TaxID=42192 RepID=A0A6J8BHU8_MYTCO|nr:CHS1 [Mytilus coruscus]
MHIDLGAFLKQIGSIKPKLVIFRLDTDQFIRQKAVETYILQNEDIEVSTEEIEYYEFEGLDGDVDFTSKAVRLLVDRMVKNEELGAACGRIHPIGKGGYLKPLDADKKEQETMKQALGQLRNEVVAGFAFINLIWISINFMFQLGKPAIIEFPKTPLQNQFKCGKNESHGNIGEENAEKIDAKKLVRFCAEVVGDPMPDYSSDEDDENEDEEDDKVEEELSNTIFNNAVRGVKGNIGGTRTSGVGMSFRETMVIGRDNISNNLRSTLSSPNFRQRARNMLAISKLKYDERTIPFPKGNVLRYRKKSSTKVKD